MRNGESTSVVFIAILAIIFLVASSGATEGEPDEAARGWVLRISPTWLESDLDDEISVGSEGETFYGVGAEDLGLGIAAEYRFSPLLGLEIGVLTTSNGVGVRVRDGVVVASGTSTYYALTVGPDFHLTPNHPTDLYAGPFLALTSHSDVGFHRQYAGVGIGSDGWGWGAVLGVDVPIGERGWLFCANARYLDSSLDATNGHGDSFDLDFGPIAVGVGAGYRF